MLAAPRASQELLEDLMQRLALAQADAAEANARKILLGLGFSRDVQDHPMSSLSGRVRAVLPSFTRGKRDVLPRGALLSIMKPNGKLLTGGWQMRAALAKALYLGPDILLLDEPTNFLDLPSIIWFQVCQFAWP